MSDGDLTNDHLFGMRERYTPGNPELAGQFIYIHRSVFLALIDEVLVHRSNASLQDDLDSL